LSTLLRESALVKNASIAAHKQTVVLAPTFHTFFGLDSPGLSRAGGAVQQSAQANQKGGGIVDPGSDS